ncbi:hypothetical protein WMF26_06715 [Sorangium sp. So ce185]|uniref:hypothetical protein n=1 Tax=Sorangium sp. So ce185 TaxID=3133287 RepID=UPI003F61DBB6
MADSDTYDILILIDVNNQTVQMYAADTGIVQAGSQGTNELWVKVPAESNLRWRVEPLQAATFENGELKLYHTLITKFHLWAANAQATPPQGDASKYLTEWGCDNGSGNAPFYATPETITPDTNIGTSTQGIYRPYIQCTTALGRDETQSQKLAYTFYVQVYKAGKPYGPPISWDPYVTVYRSAD